jgi:hypothetical protein
VVDLTIGVPKEMKKFVMLLALLLTFSLTVFAQDAPKPANGASTSDATATTPVKHAKAHHVKHHVKHHKATKTQTVAKATDATKTPTESTPVAK